MFYIVGHTETCTSLAVCASESAASKFIATLPKYEDGRYYIDACGADVGPVIIGTLPKELSK